jgi:hypothetical protein
MVFIGLGCYGNHNLIRKKLFIRVITKLPNSEQSYKEKVKTHKYINRQNQSTTGKLWKRHSWLLWYVILICQQRDNYSIESIWCVGSNTILETVLDTPLCDSILQRLVNVWYFLRFLYKNKSDRCDIAGILLNVALETAVFKFLYFNIIFLYWSVVE